MKPPSRPHTLPSRFKEVKKSDTKRGFRPGCHRMEYKRLLFALKNQNRLNPDLDILALRKKVPKWSLLQIQNVVRFLRRSVVQRVYLQVRKQRREEQKSKVPIELWAELAQKMAGDHVETISSAFSQMLIIAATEPYNLIHSVPPRPIDSQTPPTSGLRTVPLRHPKSHPGSPSTVMCLPGRSYKTLQPHGIDVVYNLSAQRTTGMFPSVTVEEGHSELQQSSGADKALATQSKSPNLLSLVSQPVFKQIPLVSASSAHSTVPPLLTSNTDQFGKKPESGQSEPAWQCRPIGMKSVVDFEKIYQFLSNISLRKQAQPLTAMESAVLLDLLMSLPEELPLLDCKEMQHHLLQVHALLNRPAESFSRGQGPVFTSSASSREEQQPPRAGQHAEEPDIFKEAQNVHSTREESVQKGQVPEQVKAIESPLDSDNFAGQSPAINQLKVKGDWTSVGLCPLNPFMVPVALLKRQ